MWLGCLSQQEISTAMYLLLLAVVTAHFSAGVLAQLSGKSKTLVCVIWVVDEVKYKVKVIYSSALC